MIAEFYPKLWGKEFGNNPIENNQLTTAARNWIECFKGLTTRTIKTAFNNLCLKHPTFPPTAMEFRNLCLTLDNEEIVDELLCRIEEGDSYRFTNKAAFNFWMKYSFNLLNGNKYEIPKLVNQNIRMLDPDSMFELPDYNLKAIPEKPEPTSNLATEKEIVIFQSHMRDAIYEHDHELFRSGKLQDASNRTLNREPEADLPPVMKKIFSRQGTLDLIKIYKKTNGELPNVIVKPKFTVGNKVITTTTEYKKKRGRYLDKYKTAVRALLIAEGVLT
jgi:hypothetical protein